MNRKVAAVVTVILIVSAGIVVNTNTNTRNQTPAESASAETANPLTTGTLSSIDSSFKATEQLIERSATPTGQYRPLLTDNASLYATHHFTSIPRNAALIPNKEQTRKWLQNIQNQSFQTQATESNKSVAVLQDRYYTITSLSRLNGTIRKASVRADIQKFRLPNGAYCRERTIDGRCHSRNGSVLATYWAVQVADVAGGISEENRAETISWLSSQWEDVNNFESIGDVGVGYRILQSLKTLDANSVALTLDKQSKRNLHDHREQLINQINNRGLDIGYSAAYNSVIEHFKISNQSLNHSVRRYLVKSQNEDGGFGVFSQNSSDSKGTALALQSLSSPDIRNLDRTSLRNFITYHVVPTGGFALTSDSRGNLQTTRYAVSALGLLDESPKYSDALSTQLQDTYRAIDNRPKPASPKLLFVLTTIAKHVNDSQPPQDIVNNSLNATFSRDLSEVSLSQLFYATSVGADYGYNLPEQAIASRIYTKERPNGGFGKPVTTTKTYHSVKTLQLINRTVSHPNRTIEFLKTAEQNGGYQLRKGDRFAPYPDVYATYLTISTLAALDSRPSNLTRTKQWLQQLHNARGTFTPYSEQPSEPQIQHIYWALSSLNMLEEQHSPTNTRIEHRTIPNPYLSMGRN